MGDTATEPAGTLAGQRWARRPASSAVVRGVVFAVPLAAGFGAALLVAGTVPRPSSVLGTIGWGAATLVASLLAVVLVDRLARRLLPLATLLRLTLVFPDRAPSRLAVALGASRQARLDHELRRAGGADDEASVRALVTLAAALTNHDRRTRGHAERTRALAEVVGEELGLSSRDRDRLRWAALLHDIGKIRVPAALLNKRGPLTESEWATMARHPREGAALVESMRPWLGEWVDGVGQHHERFDGSGYPDGLARDEISLAARIIAVADSFETMTAVRSYNTTKTVAEARRELVRCAGSDFDPAVVRGFLNVSLGRVRWTIGPVAWIGELPLLRVPARVSAEVPMRATTLQPAAKAAVGAALVAAATVAAPAVPATTSLPVSSVPAAAVTGGGGSSVATLATTAAGHALTTTTSAPPPVVSAAAPRDSQVDATDARGRGDGPEAGDAGRGNGHNPWHPEAGAQGTGGPGGRGQASHHGDGR